MKNQLMKYGEYIRDFEQSEYMMRADDQLIIQNYWPIFSSWLYEKLRKPVFQSNDNADFYDTMMANGGFIQLGSFLFNPKTTTTAAAIIKSAQEYESY